MQKEVRKNKVWTRAIKEIKALMNKAHIQR